MTLRMFTATIRRVQEHRRRRIRPGKRTGGAHIAPKPAGPCLALSQDRYRGVVRMDARSAANRASLSKAAYAGRIRLPGVRPVTRKGRSGVGDSPIWFKAAA